MFTRTYILSLIAALTTIYLPDVSTIWEWITQSRLFSLFFVNVKFVGRFSLLSFHGSLTLYLPVTLLNSIVSWKCFWTSVASRSLHSSGILFISQTRRGQTTPQIGHQSVPQKIPIWRPKCAQRLLVWISSISTSDQPRKISPCEDWVPWREKWQANSCFKEDKLCFDM